MYKDSKKSFWSDAAKGGAVIGLAMALLVAIDVLSVSTTIKTIVALVRILAFVYLVYYFAKKRALSMGDEGFTFSQSMGYILAMMLFAGFLYGIGYCFSINVLNPDFINTLLDKLMIDNPFIDPEIGEGVMRSVLSNPIFWTFTGIITMVIYGGISGLVISAIIKRQPNVFGDS